MFRIAIRRHIWAWGSILFHRRGSRDGVFRLVLFRLLKYIKIHVLAPRVLFKLWVVTQQRLLPGSFIFAKQNPICVRRLSGSHCSTKHNSWLPLNISLWEVVFELGGSFHERLTLQPRVYFFVMVMLSFDWVFTLVNNYSFFYNLLPLMFRFITNLSNVSRFQIISYYVVSVY